VVEELGLTAQGDVDLEDAARRLREDTCLVCHMLVNNEFGSLYAVAELAGLVRARAPRARVHVDAVQAVGKLELTLDGLGVDALSLSAHKIHGPKGAGALLLAPGVEPRPLLLGGGQERGLRSGTENVAGIAGCARAVELAVARRAAADEHLRGLLALLRSELARVRGARLLLDPSVASSPAIAALVLPGAPAEVWMHHLEARGVMTSAGSACHARSREVSPALLALGIGPEEARRVLRLSFSRLTTREDVLRGVDALEEVERELRPAVQRRR
jgi:cysteine desulfurase